MKLINFIFCSILISCNLLTVSAQDSKTYYAFSYTKLSPGKRSAYLNLIKNYSPVITAERIRTSPGVLGWYMYELRMPSGASNDHDFVSITMVSDFNLLFDELNPPEGTMERLLPGISTMTINGIFETYESSRTVLRKEVTFPVLDLAPGAKPSKIAWVDYVKVTDESEFLKTEAGTLTPFYKDLIAKGLITNCRIYKKTMPVDPSADFDFVVAYFAEDVASVADGRLREALKKSVLGRSSSKKIMRSELWQLVEYVDVEKSKR